MKNKKLIFIISIILITLISYFVFTRFIYSSRLNREILDKSLESGKNFLVNNQNPQGNFVYEYDFITKKLSGGDSQVRQAGALWGVALIHHDQPSVQTYSALKKGFDFFDSISIPIDSNQNFIVYPFDNEGSTGTVALVCLAYIEILQTKLDKIDKTKYNNNLKKYLNFLLSLRKSDGHFYPYYDLKNGKGVGEPSPYFDGEALLALCRAARYLGYSEFRSIILESAEVMYNKYVIEARKLENDSPTTKGFYQWSSMSFYEIYSAGWDDRYAERIIDLAYWMIDIHKTLWRMKNTAYAQEGIITAWQTAKMSGNKKAMRKFRFVVDKGLRKLTKWQVGGPIQNRFLRINQTKDPKAVGGIMNCMKCPNLRIDVTQHQMHAVILARKYIYK